MTIQILHRWAFQYVPCGRRWRPLYRKRVRREDPPSSATAVVV